ncbi:transposase [Streptomyces sp. NPDC052016]|uniref:transposase n=1 Tax=Streptomyces sp. NPDC052016 TaxID=3365680 RepID=UPI0037D0FF32
MTDAHWARIEPLLPDRTPKLGCTWRDHREVIDAIPYKFQTDSQWVHPPEKYGNWRGVYRRLRRPSTAPGSGSVGRRGAGTARNGGWGSDAIVPMRKRRSLDLRVRALPHCVESVASVHAARRRLRLYPPGPAHGIRTEGAVRDPARRPPLSVVGLCAMTRAGPRRQARRGPRATIPPV